MEKPERLAPSPPEFLHFWGQK